MIIQDQSGIWKYERFFPNVRVKNRITLGEGATPLLKIEDIYFKCEYKNPTGSVKDRGLAYQVSKLSENKIKFAVISSSGNAGISAASYCRQAKVKLTVFISPRINRAKFKILKGFQAKIIMTLKPISSAIKYAKELKAYNLRPSTDFHAVTGFSTITYEISEDLPEADAIFIPVSSGTTLVGIERGIIKLGKSIALHAVQTGAVHPIGEIYDKNYIQQDHSIADAIVARVIPRRLQILQAIRASHGSGWVVTDDQIVRAHNWLKEHDVICSYEGAVSLAGYWKARDKGLNYRYPVCLLTGSYYKHEFRT